MACEHSIWHISRRDSIFSTCGGWSDPRASVPGSQQETRPFDGPSNVFPHQCGRECHIQPMPQSLASNEVYNRYPHTPIWPHRVAWQDQVFHGRLLQPFHPWLILSPIYNEGSHSKIAAERCASRAMTNAAIFECKIDIFQTNLKLKLCEAKNWSEKKNRQIFQTLINCPPVENGVHSRTKIFLRKNSY